MLFKPEWLLRILSAVIVGMIIGYERRSHSKEAGIRTHALVAMASCLLMIISREGFADAAKVDASRIAAQVVSGVGFLGAGIIFVRNDMIQGLTTAAGIWATSALGMCFGAGMYIVGLFCSLIVIIIHGVFRKYFNFNSPRNIFKIEVHLRSDGKANIVTDCLNSMHYKHTDNTITSDGQGGWYVKTEINTHQIPDFEELTHKFRQNEKVIDIKIL